ncbi:MAG TPA: hypothetical protein VNF47_08320 [Streptosporangiaceae bacterium]|nr:hypothetical protein [Streptosporangiaceae bacterium]
MAANKLLISQVFPDQPWRDFWTSLAAAERAPGQNVVGTVRQPRMTAVRARRTAATFPAGGTDVPERGTQRSGRPALAIRSPISSASRSS